MKILKKAIIGIALALSAMSLALFAESAFHYLIVQYTAVQIMIASGSIVLLSAVLGVVRFTKIRAC